MDAFKNRGIFGYTASLAEEFYKEGKTRESLACVFNAYTIIGGASSEEQEEMWSEFGSHFDYLFELASQFEQEKSYDLAEACYKISNSLHPDSLHSQCLGEFYLRQRQFAAAKICLERALELHKPSKISEVVIPDFIWGEKESEKEMREVLGEICLHLGDFQYADENFTRAGETAQILGEDPGDSFIQDIYLNLFDKYLAKSDFDFCIGILKRAIVAVDNGDNDFLAKVNMGLRNCYLGKGIVENAKLCFSHALELAPGNGEAKEQLRKLEAK